MKSACPQALALERASARGGIKVPRGRARLAGSEMQFLGISLVSCGVRRRSQQSWSTGPDKLQIELTGRVRGNIECRVLVRKPLNGRDTSRVGSRCVFAGAGEGRRRGEARRGEARASNSGTEQAKRSSAREGEDEPGKKRKIASIDRPDEELPKPAPRGRLFAVSCRLARPS